MAHAQNSRITPNLTHFNSLVHLILVRVPILTERNRKNHVKDVFVQAVTDLKRNSVRRSVHTVDAT